MGWIVFAVIFFLLFLVLSSGKNNKEPIEDASIIKGYEIHVTPDVRTRLKVLKMRGRTFRSKQEADMLDFEPHEAIPIAETASWEEMGFDIPDLEPGTVWTDIGMIREDRIEPYYQFLEKFREIIEDDSISPPEKVKRIKKIDDPGRFLPKLRKKYGKDFPTNVLVKPLTDIDGISQAIAIQLFKNKVYNTKDLFKISDEDLLRLKGLGASRLQQIKSSLKTLKQSESI